MRINDLIIRNTPPHPFILLKERCGQFFQQAQGLPLFKNLSIKYKDFDKVKVRVRRDEDVFTETFNEAFETKHPGLRQRAIFANGELSFESAIEDTLEPFYIFPIDGYKFMYSTEVENSGQEYKQVFDTLFEQFGEARGNEVATELLKFTYTSKTLHEGISCGAEIIIYGIPYFYVVRCATVDQYSTLLSTIKHV